MIRPKLDYGCIVYGAASETQLKSLNAILHEAMRIATGAFRSTLIENLHILTNEPALHYRREELLLRYYFKNKCYLLNAAYSCVVNRNLEDYFLPRSINFTLIDLSIREALHKLSIQTLPVVPFITPSIYSWKKRDPVVDLQLTDFNEICGDTGVTPDVFREVAQEQYGANYNKTLVRRMGAEEDSAAES